MGLVEIYSYRHQNANISRHVAYLLDAQKITQGLHVHMIVAFIEYNFLTVKTKQNA